MACIEDYKPDKKRKFHPKMVRRRLQLEDYTSDSFGYTVLNPCGEFFKALGQLPVFMLEHKKITLRHIDRLIRINTLAHC